VRLRGRKSGSKTDLLELALATNFTGSIYSVASAGGQMYYYQTIPEPKVITLFLGSLVVLGYRAAWDRRYSSRS
jgi:hypothetical protein